MRTAVVIAALCVAGSAHAQGAPLPRRALDSVFTAVSRTNGPGCAVGVAERGQPRVTAGYGMADLERGVAISPMSIFHVASVSKQFAAFSVALLAEDGRLSLDDPVRRHVPELPEYAAPITIRQLIHHTSGLRDQWSLLAAAGWRFPSDLITERDVMQIVSRQRALNFRPGDEYVYSNTGYTLLAVIVQRVSGQSLRDFAHERIFVPLKMQHTHFHDDFQMVVPGRTSAYEPRGAGVWRVSEPTFDTYGATSLFSTVDDLLTWMEMLDAPPREFAAVVRQAQESGVLNDGTRTDYGFGLALNTWRGIRAVGHDGADAGYRASVERYPEFGLAVAVFCNASNAGPNNLVRATARRVLGNRLPMEMVEARAPEHQPSAAAADAWLGTFRDTVNHQIWRVERRADSLFLNGARLQFGSDTTATFANIPGWISLQARGDSSTIRLHPRGRRQQVFLRQPPAFPSLAAYAGSYVSSELDTRYDIVFRDSALVRTHRKLPTVPLRAAGRDVFTSPAGTFIFRRDRRGRVVGFTLNNDRVRGVSFVRAP